MKTIDERKMEKTAKEKQTKAERRTEAIVKGWELNDFVVHLS